MTSAFSISAIQKTFTENPQKKPEFFNAKDDLKIAYYSFVPENAKAVIVFYHSAATWSMPLYQAMAQETAKKYNMAVYLFDIRGHGNSEGPRGDAPNVNSVLNDVSSALAFVKSKYPSHFLMLAGHSSGVGLILNYLLYPHSKDTEVDGYVFLAPFLGSDSGTEIKKNENKFITKVKLLNFIVYGFTGGHLCAHRATIFFNNSDLRNLDNKILPSYSCTMASAIFPKNVKKIISNITKPCALFVGQEDEQFNPLKVVGFQKYFGNHVSVARIIAKTGHFSIILKAPDLFQEAWQSFMKDTEIS